MKSFHVLVVCLANVCRSPMAEALLARRLRDVDVGSAGIEGLEGHAADPFACDVMHARGLDIAAHRARRLDAAMCVHADLILVMEEAQRRCIERRFPLARPRLQSRPAASWRGLTATRLLRRTRPVWRFPHGVRAVR